MWAVLIRLAIAALWCLRLLPLSLLAPLGGGLGWVAFHFWRERRQICLANLEACFPDLTERERRMLAKQHFAALSRSVLERGILWWSPGERVARVIRIVGAQHWARGVQPLIVLLPHFVRLAAPAPRLNMEPEPVSVYSRQKHPVVNELLVRYRTRFKPVILRSRQDGALGVIRA